jgi:hypothetical protein
MNLEERNESGGDREATGKGMVRIFYTDFTL